MEVDTILLWFSKISLVFWTGVLVWCVGTIVMKYRKEKQWLGKYQPTLQAGIDETKVRSWTTLNEIKRSREMAVRHVKKGKRGPAEKTDTDVNFD